MNLKKALYFPLFLLAASPVPAQAQFCGPLQFLCDVPGAIAGFFVNTLLGGAVSIIINVFVLPTLPDVCSLIKENLVPGVECPTCDYRVDQTVVTSLEVRASFDLMCTGADVKIVNPGSQVTYNFSSFDLTAKGSDIALGVGGLPDSASVSVVGDGTLASDSSNVLGAGTAFDIIAALDVAIAGNSFGLNVDTCSGSFTDASTTPATVGGCSCATTLSDCTSNTAIAISCDGAASGFSDPCLEIQKLVL